MPEDERPNVEGVLRALGRLPFNQRAALVMRELEGRSYVEIADTLGVSVAAVETLIFRARRSLRVRAAALRSITAVPLPASLTQLVRGRRRRRRRDRRGARRQGGRRARRRRRCDRPRRRPQQRADAAAGPQPAAVGVDRARRRSVRPGHRRGGGPNGSRARGPARVARTIKSSRPGPPQPSRGHAAPSQQACSSGCFEPVPGELLIVLASAPATATSLPHDGADGPGHGRRDGRDRPGDGGHGQRRSALPVTASLRCLSTPRPLPVQPPPLPKLP